MCKLPVEGRRWSHYDRNASCVNANFAQLCSRRRRGRLFMQCVDIFHIKEREPSSSFRIFRKIMGINTLLPFVKEATTKMNIKDFAGPESRAKDANLIGIFLIFYKRGGGGILLKTKTLFAAFRGAASCLGMKRFNTSTVIKYIINWCALIHSTECIVYIHREYS